MTLSISTLTLTLSRRCPLSRDAVVDLDPKPPRDGLQDRPSVTIPIHQSLCLATPWMPSTGSHLRSLVCSDQRRCFTPLTSSCFPLLHAFGEDLGLDLGKDAGLQVADVVEVPEMADPPLKPPDDLDGVVDLVGDNDPTSVTVKSGASTTRLAIGSGGCYFGHATALAIGSGTRVAHAHGPDLWAKGWFAVSTRRGTERIGHWTLQTDYGLAVADVVAQTTLYGVDASP